MQQRKQQRCDAAERVLGMCENILVTACAFFMLITACGGKEVGNTNENNNNQPNNLKREAEVHSISNGLALFRTDGDFECDESLYPDITAEPGRLLFLCRAVTWLDKRGITFGIQPEGWFQPDQEVNEAETWKRLVEILGFMPFDMPVVADLGNMDVESWYYRSFSTLYVRGLVMLDEDGNPNPGAVIPVDNWNLYLEKMQEFLGRPANRLRTLETLLMTLTDQPLAQPSPCVPAFLDVEPDTIECVVSNAGLAVGLLDPDQQNFRGDDPVSWPESAVLVATVLNIPPSQNLTCAPGCEGRWACSEINGLCEAGVLSHHLDFDDSYAPAQSEMNSWFFDLQSRGY